jgi:hypothetical protein
MMFDSVLIAVCDTVPFPAGVVANATPLAFTRFAVVKNAFFKPVIFVLLVPTISVPGDMNCASAYTAATEDTSLIFSESVLVSAPQSPSASINVAALFSPAPASPPCESTYTCVEDVGHV